MIAGLFLILREMDAAEYKHIVLGLIFLKYVSDTFSERRSELQRKFTDPDDEYYLPDQTILESELEDRDHYTESNVFWVPENARWESIRNNAKQRNPGNFIVDAILPSGQIRMIEVHGAVKGLPGGGQEIAVRT
jgi:type I restriction enzyme M protein